MLRAIRGLFSPDMSIDLGTANTLIFIKNQGIVLNEPSVVAMRPTDRTVAAVGTAAKSMLGKTPKEISVIRPMKDGQIADFYVTSRMLRYFIDKAIGGKFFAGSPRVLVCIPCKSTQVEQRAIRDSVDSAGAREVFLIEEPLAAAVGANLNIRDARGSMVVDIGGGTTDIAIMALNGVVVSESIRVGGDEFDTAVMLYVRQKEGCVIGESTAEQIKKQIGTAIPLNEVKEMTVTGHHLSAGVPRRFVLNSDHMNEALHVATQQVMEAVRAALQRCPPELSVDIAESGIMLTGGGALLHGLDELLQQETGLPVMVAEKPLTCVAEGCGKILDSDYINYLALRT